MNYKFVAKYLGILTLALGLLMIPSLVWAAYYQEWQTLIAFSKSIVATVVASGILFAFGRNASDTMSQREALLMVALSWFVASFVGALPYITTGSLNIVDAIFESASGFTTTGSTVIQDIEAQPKSLLFWRALSQWLGGVGIVVLFIAVLPYLGAGGKQLFKNESTGTDPRGITPRIKDTASMLYKTYFALTISLILILMLAGMPFFDAICHTFTTLSTGGFSTKQASIAAFDSVAIETIIIVFMIVGGTNLILIFAMFSRDWKTPFIDTEWRWFVTIICVVIMIITANLSLGTHFQNDLPQEESYSPIDSLRIASFQTVSLLTGTGFGIHNYDQWPHFSRMLLFTVMFLGGCAGSTAGGLKIVRVVMLTKIAYWRIENTFRPKTVRAIRIGNNVIDDDTRKTVHAFFVIYITLFILGTIFMSGVGLPFESAMSTVASTLNNIGPGFDMVGPMQDYSQIPGFGKLFLCLCMILGRLELFSICVLFIPGFWRR